MKNVTRINDNEYVAIDPATGGTWRVIGPGLSEEKAVQAIEQQIEDTGARPAQGMRTTIPVGIRMGDQTEPDMR